MSKQVGKIHFKEEITNDDADQVKSGLNELLK